MNRLTLHALPLCELPMFCHIADRAFHFLSKPTTCSKGFGVWQMHYENSANVANDYQNLNWMSSIDLVYSKKNYRKFCYYLQIENETFIRSSQSNCLDQLAHDYREVTTLTNKTSRTSLKTTVITES